MIFAEFSASGQLNNIPHRNPFKADRLLESETNTGLCPLGNIHLGDIFSIKKDTAGGGLIDAGNHLGKGGFSTAVGTGDNDELTIFHG